MLLMSVILLICRRGWCSELLHHIRNQAGLEEWESQLWSLKCIHQKWEECRSIFYSNPGSCSYQVDI